MATLDPSVIARYLKIWALAERGAPGERDAARARMDSMAERYPGLHKMAERARDAATGKAPVPPEAGIAWSDILRTVTEVFGAATQLSQGVHAARRARPFHEFGHTDGGKKRVRLGVEFGVRTLDDLVELDVAGQEGFRRELHEKLDAAFDELLDALADANDDEDDDLD